mmetsp:Transcript_13309/g.19916  ORF Transcript_13309/g.19916 Transcript_13309/m.19916 type:complete len:190 (+) Transcript_13309:1104-1673(+)
MVDTLEEDEVKKIKAEFDKIDESGDGMLEISEIAKILDKAKPGEAKKIMKNLDLDGDGKVSIHEFNMAFVNRKVTGQQERMWSIFNSMDLDGDGKLSTAEVKKTLGKGLTPNDFDAIMKTVDKDSDGKIDYLEFLEAWHMRGVSRYNTEKDLPQYEEKKEQPKVSEPEKNPQSNGSAPTKPVAQCCRIL